MRDELAIWEDDGGAVEKAVSDYANAPTVRDQGDLPKSSDPAGLRAEKKVEAVAKKTIA